MPPTAHGIFPKVVGGVTPRCAELAVLLYQQFIEKRILLGLINGLRGKTADGLIILSGA